MQGHPECKRFRFGYPEYTPQLEVIFKNCIVDGSTGYVPQDVTQDAGTPEENHGTPQDDDGTVQEHEVGEEEDDEFDSSSLMSTTNSRKRGSSTTNTGTCPNAPEKKPKGQKGQKGFGVWCHYRQS